MNIEKGLIDKLLADYKVPEDLIGGQGLLKELTRALVERAMHAELTHHLGYEKHDPGGKGSGNSRNGTSAKTLKGDFGEVEIEVPRDRNGSFEPKIVPRHQRRFSGFDEHLSAMRTFCLIHRRSPRCFQQVDRLPDGFLPVPAHKAR